MDFISNISLDCFKSFIREYRTLSFLFCSLTGIGLYGLYTYKLSPKNPTNKPDNRTNPDTPDNIRWVQTNDGKTIKLYKNFANSVLQLDTQIEKEKKIKILELYCQHALKRKHGQFSKLNLDIQTTDNSQHNPYHISCSQNELHLILKAVYGIRCHMSLLQFTPQELDTLGELATRFDIKLISSMIANINLLTISAESPFGLSDILIQNHMQTFFEKTEFSKASLFRDIMSLYIRPEIHTKEEFNQIVHNNSPFPFKKKPLNRWTEIKGGQYEVLFYTPDEKYYVTHHLTLAKADHVHEFRIYLSATDTLIGAIPTEEQHCRPILFPLSNKLVYCIHESVESCHYSNRYSVYDIEQGETISLPQELPLFTTIAISPDEKMIACAAADGVYLINIADIENILHKHIPHPYPKHLAFSPNGSHLVFGCTRQDWMHDNLGAEIVLCNIKGINWNTNENEIPSKTILHKNIECRGIRFEDDNTVIAENHESRFGVREIVIDMSGDTIKINELELCNTHINSTSFPIDIYDTCESKDRKISGFQAIASQQQLFIYSRSGEKLFSQKTNIGHYGKLLVSKNRNYWATTPKFNLLSYKNNIFSDIETEQEGRCLQLNNDGSFWLSTTNAINFYNEKQECYMTFDCSPFYLFSPEIKEKENQIICHHWDQWDTGDKISKKSKITKQGLVTRWQIPSEKDTAIIYNIIDRLSPLQFMFVKDMSKRKDQDMLTLRKQSLHEKIFTSFEPNDREVLGKYLGISAPCLPSKN